MPFNDVLDKKIVFKTHLFIYSTEIFRFLEANEMYIYIYNYNYVDIYIYYSYIERDRTDNILYAVSGFAF